MARLKSNLTRIAAQVPNVAKEALLQTGADVLSIAKQLVPVDTSSLQRSGGVVPVSSTSIEVGFGAPGVFFDGREPATYARHVEYGTTNSAAQPFFTPAFAQAESIFKARLLEKVKKLA